MNRRDSVRAIGLGAAAVAGIGGSVLNGADVEERLPNIVYILADDLAGIQIPRDTDGISLVPTFLADGSRLTEREFLYWEMPAKGGAQAVRMGKWKGIRLQTQKPDPVLKLYDLEADIEEKADLADRYPKIVAAIEKIMDREHTESEIFGLLPGE